MTSTSKNSNKAQLLLRALPYLFIALYFCLNVALLHDYFINIDSLKNFLEGELNLRFLLTGRAELPPYWAQMHGAFPFMAADIFRMIFNERLAWLDPFSARHLVNPVFFSVFLVYFFRFLSRQIGRLSAFTSIALLATYPVFFGHLHNNIKDIHTVIYFCTSICLFAEWIYTGSRFKCISFFIFYGLALCTKLYVLLLIPVLALWLILFPKSERHLLGKAFASWFYVFLGLIICITLFLLFYSPAFLALPNAEPYLADRSKEIQTIFFSRSIGFQSITFIHSIFQTPSFMIVAFLAGMFGWALLNKSKVSLARLLIIWLLFPLFFGALPHIYHYDGMRHFMIFIPPLCVICAIGISIIADLILKMISRTEGFETILKVLLISSIIGFNILGIIQTHPYETTYYSFFAGGLKGAQKRGLGYAWDFWYNSAKEAGKWLDENAAPNADILVQYRTPFNVFHNKTTLEYAVEREDLKVYRWRAYRRIRSSKGLKNVYYVYVPFPYLEEERRRLAGMENASLVHSCHRQGGEIFSIYYFS